MFRDNQAKQRTVRSIKCYTYFSSNVYFHIFLFLLQRSHLSAWLSSQLACLNFLSPDIIVIILTFMASVMTEVISNMSMATIMLPVVSEMVRIICTIPSKNILQQNKFLKGFPRPNFYYYSHQEKIDPIQFTLFNIKIPFIFRF